MSSHNFSHKTNKTHSGYYPEYPECAFCLFFILSAFRLFFGRNYGPTIFFQDLLTFIYQYIVWLLKLGMPQILADKLILSQSELRVQIMPLSPHICRPSTIPVYLIESCPDECLNLCWVSKNHFLHLEAVHKLCRLKIGNF